MAGDLRRVGCHDSAAKPMRRGNQLQPPRLLAILVDATQTGSKAMSDSGLAGIFAGVPAGPPEIYGVFCGNVDQASVARIMSGMATAINNRVPRLHLLFQSSGGLVGDGVCLYNFLKALPIPLTIYNVGSVSSIAALAYLGAEERKVSAHATFMLHRTYASPQAAGAERSPVPVRESV
jgi:hypothetical protein